jgi:hypothetical protein
MLSLRRCSIAFLCGIGLTGCNTNPAEVLSGVDPTPSEAINTILQKAEGETMVIAGKVGTIAPLIGQVAFEVQDNTGAVWVLSDSRPPSPNSQVKIHGIIRTQQGERYLDQK